jgi:pectinesterase
MYFDLTFRCGKWSAKRCIMVFDDCVLTGDTSLHNVSLGRSWRPFASVTYMHCYIGPHIKPEGWSNWNKTDNYKTTRYSEYENHGPGASIAERVSWSKQLTDAEAENITIEKVFNGWQPKDCNFKR